MGTPKPRILPWLVSQLDLGQLEGVAWVNESRTRFRIPWKHGLRQDAQEEDFRIFQVRETTGDAGNPELRAGQKGLLAGRAETAEAWAEATGAYVPGRDKPDLPTWKRNFRSALNRKDVCLAEDRSKDPHDPHKIYEFVNSGVGDFSQPDYSPDTNGGGSTSDTQENILDELLGNMVLAPLPDPGPPSLAVAPQHLQSPSLDSPTPFPNLEPSENPLKRLLVPGEDLITFTEGSGRSPRYALWFCVGESWPQDQPWTKRLVMVKVVPTCLRALVEIARVGGASSLENTVDLHISNSHPLSLTSDQYKAYLQDLVEDMDFQGPGET
uniref:interferon regulatory factor 3 isoform X6 n=1 Tax=Macaca mulatta TaxID=9544 RepID=UPI0010A1FD2B|nr:interferon regulatory factor 3 isoform X6 [Macaca mulatta]